MPVIEICFSIVMVVALVYVLFRRDHTKETQEDQLGLKSAAEIAAAYAEKTEPLPVVKPAAKPVKTTKPVETAEPKKAVREASKPRNVPAKKTPTKKK